MNQLDYRAERRAAMVKLLTDKDANINLDEIARQGAKRMLEQALEQEVQEFIENNKEQIDENGHRLVVRHGKAKERTVTMASGSVQVKAPRVKDKRAGEKFTSTILPPYLRKSVKVESLLPALYLRGISTGKMSDALEDFFGDGTMGLSPASISKLIKIWEKDLEHFKIRRLTKKYVYLWADGVYMNIRLGDDKKVCILVVIGVTESGEKELLAAESGFRESADNWLEVLSRLVNRGLNVPKVAIADGALGFWSALRKLENFQATREQRCWVHKIANVLGKLPKSIQFDAKNYLHEMMKAPDKATAVFTKNNFERIYKDKYPKAVECLEKDWSQLTTFFDFPAEHWISLRTTNPIESSFATVKLRTKVTRGAGSRKTAETMAFKLLLECEKKWRRIRGWKKIPDVLNGVEFKDGVMVYSQEQIEEAAAF
jgi:putative transposase